MNKYVKEVLHIYINHVKTVVRIFGTPAQRRTTLYVVLKEDFLQRFTETLINMVYQIIRKQNGFTGNTKTYM